MLAVREQDWQREQVVRQHLLRDLGDAIEQLPQLAGVGQRGDQFVEQTSRLAMPIITSVASIGPSSRRKG